MKNEREIKRLLAVAPPPNRHGGTFFTEKTLNKLNANELFFLRDMLERYYVPREKPTKDFRTSFSCPICNTKFKITAE